MTQPTKEDFTLWEDYNKSQKKMDKTKMKKTGLKMIDILGKAELTRKENIIIIEQIKQSLINELHTKD